MTYTNIDHILKLSLETVRQKQGRGLYITYIDRSVKDEIEDEMCPIARLTDFDLSILATTIYVHVDHYPKPQGAHCSVQPIAVRYVLKLYTYVGATTYPDFSG